MGGKIMGWARPIFFREKGWAKREFHNDWGWVIVCFVKNHTHYNSCTNAMLDIKYNTIGCYM